MSRTLAFDLAPNGVLRAAINLGNPVLAQTDDSGALTGVTVELATALADILQVPVQFIPYPSGGAVVRGLNGDAWDVGFLAAEPERAQHLTFSTPYAFIDGTCLVREGAAARSVSDVDQRDARIAVGDGAAYHLILSRQLEHATLVTAPTSAAAIDMLQDDGIDAAAGVRQTLEAASRRMPGTRVLPDSFSRIEQAIAVPKVKSPESIAFVQSFLDDKIATGMVGDALSRTAL